MCLPLFRRFSFFAFVLIFANCGSQTSSRRMITHFHMARDGKQTLATGVWERPKQAVVIVKQTNERGIYQRVIPKEQFESLWATFPEKELAPYARHWTKGYYNSKENLILARNKKYDPRFPTNVDFYIVPLKSAPEKVQAYAVRLRMLSPM